ncbi:hypothetical protein [Cytobacillus firmus]|uniref:hypothetical protein n=1 Tax=Cytobacillus firmus TaxID=1399 RepID=UPI0030015A0C
MQLNTNLNHSCFDIIIDSCLKRLGLNDSLFWNQVGLYYEQEKDTLKLISSYRSYRESLPRHGLLIEEKFYSSEEKFLADIKKFLSKGISIGLEIDAHELPYCLCYQSLHLLHTFEIESINENELIVVDHYYRYKGSIEWETLKKAFRSTLAHFPNGPSIFTVVKSEDVKIITLKECLIDNIRALKGVKKYSNTDNSGVSGIKAITAIENDVIEIIKTQDVQNSMELLSEYYNKLKEVANSRYNFKAYLEVHNLKVAAEISETLFQNWMAFANIILRYLFLKDKSKVDEKLTTRAKKIKQNELRLLEQLENALNSLGGIPE